MAKNRVLHVEDRINWLDTVRMVLERAGYEVSSFDNLPDAKAAAAAQEFDYYVCDTQIMGEDGSVWAVQLRAEGKKAMSLAGDSQPGVPLLNKGEFGDGSRLLKMLESL